MTCIKVALDGYMHSGSQHALVECQGNECVTSSLILGPVGTEGRLVRVQTDMKRMEHARVSSEGQKLLCSSHMFLICPSPSHSMSVPMSMLLYFNG